MVAIMTDRIDTLAKQCWNHRIDGTLIDGHLHFDHRKFAELIVLECMEVFSKDLPEPGDGKMLEVINRVCAVAEHFGVD